ncbi:Predicted nucleic acid-binding protein, contains PIN domain [Thiothrix eikelboomii]|uniref:Predicted nucleic acid-binding protein, contains PIN domain n=1 Tax=Thiothrix eikelboomii TaxID=92487 RepID=A0A1T4X5N1_9GAMM|nr:PIN domain-containing protein [Thiothrix eikelboomii]SKA84856.1 Predicted nucleic acid-binding protein, contains PIN domain [Thiothrix eikelboomii]
MSVKAFFDTNILVYAFDQAQPDKQIIAKRLIREFGSDGQLVLSTQVLQELYVTLSKMGKQVLPIEEVADIVNAFAEYPLVQVDKMIIAAAMKRQQSLAFSFWDSLIVEAALHAHCQILFSEDLQNGRQLEALLIQNPFKASE